MAGARDDASAAEAGIAAALRRWERTRDAIAVGLFALTTFLGLTGDPEVSWGRPWMFALSALFLLWYAGSYSPLYRRRTGGRLPRVLAYLGLGAALWLALIALDGPYLMYLFLLLTTLFPQLPLGWALGWTAALTALAIWRQVGLAGRLFDPLVVVLLVAAASAAGLGVAIDAIVRQSLARARLLAALEATRDSLVAAERQAGVLAERQRLAREIHDTLAQAFISIVTHLEAADAALPGDPATVGRHVRQARDAARENLTEARRLVHALRPEALERGPLPEVLAGVGRRWAAETGGSARSVTTGDPGPLPVLVEMVLLRCAQEALQNVRKHARASAVTITLSYLPGAVILDVCDNGRGFDPGSPAPLPGSDGGGGVGLRAMRERVAELGGTLSIESAPGRGTTLAVALPLTGAR